MRVVSPLFALMLVMAAGRAEGQDALRGKQLYQDIGRLRGAGVSCVDCHGGVPGALHGLGKAAGTPSAIAYALEAIWQMTPLRGRVSAEDMADIAAYVGFPEVPSPEPRLSTSGPAATPHSAERLEFTEVAFGSSSPASSIRLTNAGALPLHILSAPALAGTAAMDFALTTTDCTAGSTLGRHQSCTIDIVFRPREGPSGLRPASVGLSHDWIRGGVNVALIGRAGSP